MNGQNALLLELNEVNFDFVASYASRGALPNLGRLIAEHGIARTTSESQYEQLEPWIQWVTAHTGKSFQEHKVFRLGDIINQDLPQIWEILESKGLKVGAISPMNAKFRLRDPAFFVPDPWTRTDIKASRTLRHLYDALCQVVNDNASSKLTAASAGGLLRGLARYARLGNYFDYGRLAATSPRNPWRKAMFLDLLLCDVFVTEVRRGAPHFASLFLNAAAHIQHHYMFCAAPYSGERANPDWYIAPGMDPILEVYTLYDDIVGDIQRSFPEARLIIATGLHQVPYEKVLFYWRLKDHESFLREVGIPFARVQPRMSRDFLVQCADAAQAESASALLRSATGKDGKPLFEVDDRGHDLFVMLTYGDDIQDNFEYEVGGRTYGNLRKHVAFVALKNGEHDGTGYFIDTGAKRGELPEQFALKEIPQRIAAALGVGPLQAA